MALVEMSAVLMVLAGSKVFSVIQDADEVCIDLAELCVIGVSR